MAKKKKKVCGKITQVYSRVVGFHNPVSLWNKGKKEEWKDRKTFNVGGSFRSRKKDVL